MPVNGSMINVSGYKQLMASHNAMIFRTLWSMPMFALK